MTLAALEAFTGMILRPMQGPLSFEHVVRISALRNVSGGKALAEIYETDVRAGRLPRQ